MNNNSLDTSPPPPPPTTQPTQTKNRKILLAAVIITVIAVAGIAGAMAVMNNNALQTDNSNPTPTPATVETPPPASNQPQINLAEAKSIQFDMSYTSEDSTTQFACKFSAKNIGSNNMMIKVEGTFSEDSENVIYIVNGAQQKAWMHTDNQWTDLTEDFQSQWSTWSSTWQSYMQDFNAWSGTGDFTYTIPFSGDTLKISNIQINPQLPDTQFTP